MGLAGVRRHPANGRAGSDGRVVAVALLVFFALLPLQWVVPVGSTPLGQGRMHQLAILGLTAFVLLHYRPRVHAPVLHTAAVFVLANLYMFGAIAATQFYRGEGFAGVLEPVLFLVSFVALGGLVYRVAQGLEPASERALRWAAPVLIASLSIGLSVAMLVNGINPAAVLGQTVAQADPEVFQKEVFKAAFAGFGLDDDRVQGNLRHEMFGSALLAMTVSTWAMRRGPAITPREQFGYRVAMVAGVLLLTISLSRSVLIAAAVWPLLVVLRSLRRGELSLRQIGLLMTALLGFGVLVLTGLGTVIFNRFATETTGYQARTDNYANALEALPDVWVVGGYVTADVSSHNFILDYLLRNGVFAAVPAVVIVALVAAVVVLLAIRLHREPAWLVPVTAALVLPLVRLGTAGGGQIPPVEWVALAFVAGVLASWRRSRSVVPVPPRNIALPAGADSYRTDPRSASLA